MWVKVVEKKRVSSDVTVMRFMIHLGVKESF